MQFRHLATFLAIAECGTLTAAAARLYKTQGAVSHDLKALEAELGLQLIDRSGQRIALTEAGTALLPLARDVSGRLDDLEMEIRQFREGHRGVVRIGVLPSLAPSMVDLIVDYWRLRPEMQFQLLTALRGVLVEWLTKGWLDIVLADPGLETELYTERVASEPLVIVVRSDDDLVQREVVEANDLRDRPFIGFIRDRGSSIDAERLFAAVGGYPTPFCEVSDFRIMKDLIRLARGYALMPACTIRGDADFIGLKPWLPMSRHISLLMRKNREPVGPVADFSHHFVDRWPGIE